MELSFTSRFSACAALTAYSTACRFSTGSAPGIPRHTGQTLVLGSEPKMLGQPQKILLLVSSCTCTSRPITVSYLVSTPAVLFAAIAMVPPIIRLAACPHAQGWWRRGPVCLSTAPQLYNRRMRCARKLLPHLLACTMLLAPAVLAGPNPTAVNSAEVAAHVRGAMSFLASDAMRGRGSATSDEMVAATYVVSQFQSLGLDKAELQRIALPSGAVTYNAYAVLRGSDPALAGQTILISSHLDHLGTRQSPNGEVIFHGADDDASGTSAVLELARALASHRPRRTILFVCFGSEETGGQGHRGFLQNLPLPLSSIIADIEFEMIGQPDPAVGPRQLWLTGSE